MQFADKYTGVDWTNSYHNIKVDIYSDLNKKIELPDESVDCAIAISVMEHLRDPLNFAK